MGDNDSEEEYVTSGSSELFKSIGEYDGERNESYERHGQGTATYGKGDIYKGQFGNGKRNGEGIYKFKNARYEGSYKDGQRDGTGTMMYPDGSKYVGQWKEGMKNGRGVYDYANGDKYEGGWLDDAKHGNGVYYYNATGSKFYATWEKGKQTGMAKLVHSNHIYEGKFQDNLPSGKGKYTFEDGIEQHGFYTMKNIVAREHGMMTLVGRKPAWRSTLLTHVLIKKESEDIVDESLVQDQNVPAEDQDPSIGVSAEVLEDQHQEPTPSCEYLSSVSDTIQELI